MLNLGLCGDDCNYCPSNLATYIITVATPLPLWYNYLNTR